MPWWWTTVTRPTYKGAWCCRFCGEARAHGHKIYIHYLERHPEIIDARLTLLARDRDVSPEVKLSDNPTETAGSDRREPIKPK